MRKQRLGKGAGITDPRARIGERHIVLIHSREWDPPALEAGMRIPLIQSLSGHSQLHISVMLSIKPGTVT